MSGPSPNLTWEELRCKDGTPYPPTFGLRVFTLAQAFEMVRAEYGLPIVIESAYRTPEHNRKVGGAKNSQHVKGRALDLKPAKNGKLTRLVEAVQAVVRRGDSPIRGVGYYPSFVHIDVRQSDRVATWHGNRAEADKA